MNSETWKTGFMGTAKYRVLDALEHDGPLTVPELPRTWPVTRQLVEFLMDHLQDAGFVEGQRDQRVLGKKGFRITALGSAFLRARPVNPMTTMQFYSRPVRPMESLAAS